MKRSIAALLTTLAIFILSCENLNGGYDLDDATNDKIASIAEQRNAIGNSITELQGTLSALKEANIQKAKGDSIATRSQDEDNIKEESGIYHKIAAVEAQTDSLQAYIDTLDVNDDWYETTCNTLNVYDQTLEQLLALQLEIQHLKDNDETLNSTLVEIEKKIVSCTESMKNWVNSALTGYYDIATVDALLSKMKEEVATSDSAIVQDIQELDLKLQKSNEEMTVAYQQAIKEAIEENNGKLEEAAKNIIATINKRINDEIANINKRIDYIEERLSILESTVQDLLNRIQSISFIPLYEDETAVVTYPQEGTTVGSYLKMDFLISPKDIVNAIAKQYNDILSVKVAYIGSINFIDLPIIECTADTEQGIISITAAADSISIDFYNGKISARTTLSISDGKNDLTSNYIPLSRITPNPEDNCIYYTTSDKQPIKFENNTFNASIVSNTYSHKSQQFVLTFNGDITTIEGDLSSDKLTSIYLPNKLTDIKKPFDCKNLTTIRLPENISFNPISTFENCPALNTILGPCASEDSICYINNGELIYFLGAGITKYAIPNNVTTIGNSAFNGCTGLSSINIPESVTTIGNKVFSGCKGLKNITISEGVKTIGEKAFYNCEGLTSIEINCDTIGNWFSKNKSIESIVLGGNVKTIGENAFSNCTGLTNITIPNSVTTIGEKAFYNCTGLKNITIPESVTTIGNKVFSGCKGLKNITISEGVTTIGNEVFYNCEGLTDITIPNSVTTIGEKAFYYCTGLTNITISEGVKTIGENAFYNCEGLTSIEINCERIGNWFSENKSIESIVLGDNVKTIEEKAFYYCEGLKSIEINCERIGNWFSENKSIESIVLGDNVKTIEEKAFYYCTGLTDITIPESVTTIGYEAFFKCEGLTNITIPNSVTTIGEGAFYKCTGLTDITIPNSVTTIGEYAFNNCTGLTNITISEGVTTIGEGAFYYCTGLKNITIPESVTTIGYRAFSGCTGLTDITIPNSVTTIGEGAFSYCKGLTNITISEGVTTIGDRAFSSCTGLTDITIPNSVTSIGEETFSNCTGLKSITIPESVTTIGEYAFSNCTEVEKIYFEGSTPPKTSTTSFSVYPLNTIIYVPSEALNKYKQDSIFRGYNIQPY